MPKMYEQLASWFHLVTAPEEYAEEAVLIAVTLDALARRDVHTLLELGAGGGNNASFLKRRYEMTLADVSPAMLAVSRGLNPECEHIEGDMRSVRLGRRFDAVLIHDAISYMTTEEDVAAAIRTAAEHLEPGGVALFAPDDTTEVFAPRTEHGGRDAVDGRGVRWLQWEHALQGSVSLVTYAMVLRDTQGLTSVELDEHEIGVFPSATWLGLIEAAGLEARAVPSPYNPAGMFAGIDRD